MKILAIETSCDETGAAVVEGTKTTSGFSFITLGSALISQAALHAPYGGVYPTLAKREHEKNLPIILKEVESQIADKSYDAVAVTQGPGLEPALWQGIEFAKKLAQEQGLPLLPVNHMEGHIISSLVQDGKLEGIKLPVLALLISGGHTEFVLMRKWFRYERIGETLDDAVGECFDKVARMLGLAYPGGPEISKLAQIARKSVAKQVETSISQRDGARIANFQQKIMRARRDFVSRSITLPRPMLHSGTCDVSFSGLKTAALYALRGKNLSGEEKAAFAAEFEDAVADVFVAKTRRALEETGAKTFVIGGGVAANAHIRGSLQTMLAEEFPNIELRLPELDITGDNAIMIAQAALAHLLAGDWKLGEMSRSDLDIKAVGNMALGQKML